MPSEILNIENPIVNAQNLGRIYRRGREEVTALNDVTFDLEPGSFNFVVGPSGCGKSTLLHLLGGIDHPTSGTLSVAGVDLETADQGSLPSFRLAHIGFVFQFYNLLPSLTAVENVILPLLAQGQSRKAALERGHELLKEVGLTHRSQHKPAEISGGEQQRVAVARAIIGEPSIVLADEPTGELDALSGQIVMELMRRLNRRKSITFVVATHNKTLYEMGDMILALENGHLVDG